MSAPSNTSLSSQWNTNFISDYDSIDDASKLFSESPRQDFSHKPPYISPSQGSSNTYRENTKNSTTVASLTPQSPDIYAKNTTHPTSGSLYGTHSTRSTGQFHDSLSQPIIVSNPIGIMSPTHSKASQTTHFSPSRITLPSMSTLSSAPLFSPPTALQRSSPPKPTPKQSSQMPVLDLNANLTTFLLEDELDSASLLLPPNPISPSSLIATTSRPTSREKQFELNNKMQLARPQQSNPLLSEMGGSRQLKEESERNRTRMQVPSSPRIDRIDSPDAANTTYEQGIETSLQQQNEDFTSSADLFNKSLDRLLDLSDTTGNLSSFPFSTSSPLASQTPSSSSNLHASSFSSRIPSRKQSSLEIAESQSQLNKSSSSWQDIAREAKDTGDGLIRKKNVDDLFDDFEPSRTFDEINMETYDTRRTSQRVHIPDLFAPKSPRRIQDIGNGEFNRLGQRQIASKDIFPGQPSYSFSRGLDELSRSSSRFDDLNGLDDLDGLDGLDGLEDLNGLENTTGTNDFGEMDDIDELMKHNSNSERDYYEKRIKHINDKNRRTLDDFDIFDERFDNFNPREFRVEKNLEKNDSKNNKTVAVSTTTTTSLRHTITALQNQLITSRKRCADLSRELSNVVSSKEEAVTSLSHRLEQLERSSICDDDVRRQIDHALALEKAQHNRLIRVHTEEVERLRIENESAANEIDELSQRVRTLTLLEKEKMRLSTQLAETRTKLDEVTSQLEITASETDVLSAENTALSASIRLAVKEKDEISQHLRKLQTDQENIISAAVAETTTEITEKLNAQHKRLTTVHTEEVERLTFLSVSLQGDLEIEEEKCVRLREESSSLSIDKTAAERRVAELEDLLVRKIRELEEKDTLNASLTAMNEQYKREIEQMRSQAQTQTRVRAEQLHEIKKSGANSDALSNSETLSEDENVLTRLESTSHIRDEISAALAEETIAKTQALETVSALRYEAMVKDQIVEEFKQSERRLREEICRSLDYTEALRAESQELREECAKLRNNSKVVVEDNVACQDVGADESALDNHHKKDEENNLNNDSKSDTSIATYENTIKELSTSNTTLLKEVESQRLQLEQITATLSSTINEVNSLRQTNSELIQSLDSSRNNETVLLKDLQEERGRNATLLETLEVSKLERVTIEENKKSRDNQLSEELSSAHSLLETLSSALTEAQEESAEQQIRVDELTTIVREQAEKYAVLESAHENTERVIDELKKQIESYEVDVLERGKELEDAYDRIDETHGETQELHRILEEKEIEIENLQQNLKEVKHKLEKTELKYAGQDEELRIRFQQLGELEAIVESLVVKVPISVSTVVSSHDDENSLKNIDDTINQDINDLESSAAMDIFPSSSSEHFNERQVKSESDIAGSNSDNSGNNGNSGDSSSNSDIHNDNIDNQEAFENTTEEDVRRNDAENEDTMNTDNTFELDLDFPALVLAYKDLCGHYDVVVAELETQEETVQELRSILHEAKEREKTLLEVVKRHEGSLLNVAQSGCSPDQLSDIIVYLATLSTAVKSGELKKCIHEPLPVISAFDSADTESDSDSGAGSNSDSHYIFDKNENLERKGDNIENLHVEDNLIYTRESDVPLSILSSRTSFDFSVFEHLPHSILVSAFLHFASCADYLQLPTANSSEVPEIIPKRDVVELTTSEYDEVERLREEYAKLYNAYTELDEIAQEESTQLSEATKTNLTLSTECNRLREVNEALNTQQNLHDGEIEKYQHLYDTLSDHTSQLEDELSSSQKEVQTLLEQLIALKEVCKEAELEKTKLASTLVVLENRIKDLEREQNVEDDGNHEDITGDHSNVDTESGHNYQSRPLSASSVSSISSVLSISSTSSISSLSSKSATSSPKNENDENCKDALLSKLKDIQSRLLSSEQQLSEQQLTSVSLLEELKTSAQSREKIEVQHTETKIALRNALEAYQQLKNSHVNVSSELSRISQTLAEVMEREKEAAQAREKAVIELTETKIRLRDALSSTTTLKTSVEQQTMKLNNTKSVLQDTQTELQDTRSSLKSLQQIHDSLVVELEEVKSELALVSSPADQDMNDDDEQIRVESCDDKDDSIKQNHINSESDDSVADKHSHDSDNDKDCNENIDDKKNCGENLRITTVHLRSRVFELEAELAASYELTKTTEQSREKMEVDLTEAKIGLVSALARVKSLEQQILSLRPSDAVVKECEELQKEISAHQRTIVDLSEQITGLEQALTLAQTTLARSQASLGAVGDATQDLVAYVQLSRQREKQFDTNNDEEDDSELLHLHNQRLQALTKVFVSSFGRIMREPVDFVVQKILSEREFILHSLTALHPERLFASHAMRSDLALPRSNAISNGGRDGIEKEETKHLLHAIQLSRTAEARAQEKLMKERKSLQEALQDRIELGNAFSRTLQSFSFALKELQTQATVVLSSSSTLSTSSTSTTQSPISRKAITAKTISNSKIQSLPALPLLTVKSASLSPSHRKTPAENSTPSKKSFQKSFSTHPESNLESVPPQISPNKTKQVLNPAVSPQHAARLPPNILSPSSSRLMMTLPPLNAQIFEAIEDVDVTLDTINQTCEQARSLLEQLNDASVLQTMSTSYSSLARNNHNHREVSSRKTNEFGYPAEFGLNTTQAIAFSLGTDDSVFDHSRSPDKLSAARGSFFSFESADEQRQESQFRPHHVQKTESNIPKNRAKNEVPSQSQRQVYNDRAGDQELNLSVRFSEDTLRPVDERNHMKVMNKPGHERTDSKMPHKDFHTSPYSDAIHDKDESASWLHIRTDKPTVDRSQPSMLEYTMEMSSIQNYPRQSHYHEVQGSRKPHGSGSHSQYQSASKAGRAADSLQLRPSNSFSRTQEHSSWVVPQSEMSTFDISLHQNRTEDGFRKQTANENKNEDEKNDHYTSISTSTIVDLSDMSNLTTEPTDMTTGDDFTLGLVLEEEHTMYVSKRRDTTRKDGDDSITSFADASSRPNSSKDRIVMGISPASRPRVESQRLHNNTVIPFSPPRFKTFNSHSSLEQVNPNSSSHTLSSSGPSGALLFPAEEHLLSTSFTNEQNSIMLQADAALMASREILAKAREQLASSKK